MHRQIDDLRGQNAAMCERLQRIEAALNASRQAPDRDTAGNPSHVMFEILALDAVRRT